MKKLFGVSLAYLLALGMTAALAQGYKKEDLTGDQKAEMRARADKLIADRAAHPMGDSKPAHELPKPTAPPITGPIPKKHTTKQRYMRCCVVRAPAGG